MPEIDLEPHQYADRDPESGKWRRPMSKKAARNWLLLTAFGLATIFFTRDVGRSDVTFALTCGFAFAAGIFAQQWLKDLY